MQNATRRSHVLVASAALLAVVVLLAAYKTTFLHDVPRGDVAYDVCVARHLARGDGLTTNLMPLGALEGLVERGSAAADPWPSFHKFLLQQIVLVPFVKVFGATIAAARAASFVAYAALVLLVFAALVRVLRSTGWALASAIAFVSFDALNSLALSGLGACSEVLVFSIAIVLWLVAIERPKLAPLAGVALALVVLERYSFALLVPFYLVGVLWTCGRATATRAALAATAVLAPVCAWSLVRYGSLFPSPQGEQLLLFATKYFPSDPWYTSAAPHLADVGAGWRALGGKVAWSARLLAGLLFPTLVRSARNLLLAALSVAGAIRIARGSVVARKVAIVLAAFVATYVGAHLLLGVSYRYLAFVFPMAWVLACACVRDLASRADGRARAVIALAFGVALVAPEISTLLQSKAWIRAHAAQSPPDAYPNRDEIVAALRAGHPTRGLLVSGGNRPWDIALATENRVTPLLAQPEELARMRAAGLSFDLLFVPSDLSFSGDGVRPRGWLAWDAIRDARLPYVDGLALDHVFADGSLLYARSSAARAGVPYCDLPARVDLRRDGDRRYLGETFRYTERSGDVAWAWAEGMPAEIAIVACHTARRLDAKLLAAAKATIRVRVNEHVATIDLDAAMEWRDVTVALPEGAVVDGVNTITFDVAPPAGPRALAFASASLSP